MSYEQARVKRILRSGARSKLTPPARRWQTRLLGSVILVFAIASLVLNHSS